MALLWIISYLNYDAVLVDSLQHVETVLEAIKFCKKEVLGDNFLEVDCFHRYLHIF